MAGKLDLEESVMRRDSHGILLNSATNTNDAMVRLEYSRDDNLLQVR